MGVLKLPLVEAEGSRIMNQKVEVMKHALKSVADQTLVITGASSGIGLATARLAAGEARKSCSHLA